MKKLMKAKWENHEFILTYLFGISSLQMTPCISLWARIIKWIFFSVGITNTLPMCLKITGLSRLISKRDISNPWKWQPLGRFCRMITKHKIKMENPKTLMEVWEWKEMVYEDSKSVPDKVMYFHNSTKDIVNRLGLKKYSNKC